MPRTELLNEHLWVRGTFSLSYGTKFQVTDKHTCKETDFWESSHIHVCLSVCAQGDLKCVYEWLLPRFSGFSRILKEAKWDEYKRTYLGQLTQRVQNNLGYRRTGASLQWRGALRTLPSSSARSVCTYQEITMYVPAAEQWPTIYHNIFLLLFYCAGIYNKVQLCAIKWNMFIYW